MRKGTNPDVGALARTIAAGHNRDGCEAQRGRSVRQQYVELNEVKLIESLILCLMNLLRMWNKNDLYYTQSPSTQCS